MKQTNPMLLIDFYKATHDMQLPKNITKSMSYFTPRMSRVNMWDEVVMFGLQGFIKTYLIDYFNEVFFERTFDEVVEEYEKIAKSICTPPLAVDTVINTDVKTLTHDTLLKDVMATIYKTGNSNFPVYKDGMLIGVANSRKLVKEIGKKIYEKHDLDDYVNSTCIEDAINEFGQDPYYTIANKNVTLDKILNYFAENRKLSLIVITETGSLLEQPIGVVAIGDIMDVSKKLDSYGGATAN